MFGVRMEVLPPFNDATITFYFLIHPGPASCRTDSQEWIAKVDTIVKKHRK